MVYSATSCGATSCSTCVPWLCCTCAQVWRHSILHPPLPPSPFSASTQATVPPAGVCLPADKYEQPELRVASQTTSRLTSFDDLRHRVHSLAATPVRADPRGCAWIKVGRSEIIRDTAFPRFVTTFPFVYHADQVRRRQGVCVSGCVYVCRRERWGGQREGSKQGKCDI